MKYVWKSKRERTMVDVKRCDRMTNRSTARSFELFVPCWLDATKSLAKEKGLKKKKNRRQNGWKRDVRDETIKSKEGGILVKLIWNCIQLDLTRWLDNLMRRKREMNERERIIFCFPVSSVRKIHFRKSIVKEISWTFYLFYTQYLNPFFQLFL